MAQPIRIRYQSLKKELTLFFLALFYFLIATNTQTGWLFVLSAFLLGLLTVSFVLSRGRLRGVEAKLKVLGQPGRDKDMHLAAELTNLGSSALVGTRLLADCPNWAEGSSSFSCPLARVEPSQSARSIWTLVPVQRGEHQVPSVSLVSGSPLGLFTVVRHFSPETSFLIYPELWRLPTQASSSPVAAYFAEFTRAKRIGESQNFRALREYQRGDELRRVDWKASAKRGPQAPLMVREFQARSPQRTSLVLANLCATKTPECSESFEKSVSLCASMLWVAQRDGGKSCLFWSTQNGVSSERSWKRQYEALARVQLNEGPLETFWSQVQHQLQRDHAVLVVAWSSTAQTTHLKWPSWAEKILVFCPPEEASTVPPDSRLLLLDLKDGELTQSESASNSV